MLLNYSEVFIINDLKRLVKFLFCKFMNQARRKVKIFLYG